MKLTVGTVYLFHCDLAGEVPQWLSSHLPPGLQCWNNGEQIDKSMEDEMKGGFMWVCGGIVVAEPEKLPTLLRSV